MQDLISKFMLVPVRIRAEAPLPHALTPTRCLSDGALWGRGQGGLFMLAAMKRESLRTANTGGEILVLHEATAARHAAVQTIAEM